LFPIRDSVSRSREPVIVWAIIGLNVAMFLYQLSLSGGSERLFTYQHALVPLRYFYPEWGWGVGLPPTDLTPFLTSMFMHGGFLHIILNLWTLWIFGPFITGVVLLRVLERAHAGGRHAWYNGGPWEQFSRRR
jgi:membrane associated rhomboid family serine protease